MTMLEIDSPAITSADNPVSRPLWEEFARTRNPAIRRQIELAHLQLVHKLALELIWSLPNCVEIDDLEQEGFMGLRRAVERFDIQRQVEFPAYARSAIWGAMKDSLRRGDCAPRAARRKITRLEEARTALKQRLGRAPTDEELAADLRVNLEQFGWMVQASAACVRLSLNAGDEDGRMRMPADHRTPDPALEAQRRDMREVLLRGFDPMERLLVILYYFEELTMREIGITLGISESRVCQLLGLLKERIKAALERKKTEWM